MAEFDSSNPFDLAKNINSKTEHLTEDLLAGYSAYMMNRVFSNTMDTLFYVNELNGYWNNLDKVMHYDFLYHGIPRNPKRFGKWNKKPGEDENLKLVMRYYDYSEHKAREVLSLIESLGVIDEIKESFNEGGLRGAKKRSKK